MLHGQVVAQSTPVFLELWPGAHATGRGSHSSKPSQVLQSSVRKITNHLVCFSSSTYTPCILLSFKATEIQGDMGHGEWGEGNLEKG